MDGYRIHVWEYDEETDPEHGTRVNGGQISQRAIVRTFGVIAAAGVAVLIFAEVAGQPSALYDVGHVIRSVAAAVFFAAGLARMARWRLTGEATAAFDGAALLVFGSLGFPRDLAAELIYRTEFAVALTPLTRLVATGATIALLCLALRAPAVDAGLRPWFISVVVLAPSLSLDVVFVCLHQFAHLDLDPPAGAAVLVELGMTAVWSAAAVGHLRRGRCRRRPVHAWTAAWVGLVAAAGVTRALSVLDGQAWLTCAATLQVSAAALALGGAARRLFEVFAAEGDRLRSVTSALRETEDHLNAEKQRREEQVHDLRSAVAALRAATGTLDRYDGRLDHDRRHDLLKAIVDELGRLQHLVEADSGKPIVEFTLAEALAPVITTERENGLVIEPTLTPVRGYGRPADLATVVQHLLVNTRRHASGSEVAIRSWRSGSDLCLLVEDRGPGVPALEREAVFARGTRGAGSEVTPGSGLGLYVARRLMVEQGGTIEVHGRRDGGARFFLTLPVAPSERLAAPASAGAGGR